jgi:predicted oxidoreductase
MATRAGIDPQALSNTIRKFNASAQEGRDPEFGRGANAYNAYQGDPAHKPNPCLGPLATPPFYAVRIHVGDLGTFAGLRTDEEARVLAADGAPIPGLYAAGTDMASIFGGCYPGPGINLGPAMTFGYIAARHMARQAR